jgi:hypothetical protein
MRNVKGCFFRNAVFREGCFFTRGFIPVITGNWLVVKTTEVKQLLKWKDKNYWTLSQMIMDFMVGLFNFFVGNVRHATYFRHV